MILFTDSVLFVHNPKTAGTSLLHLLDGLLPGRVHRAGVAELGTYHPHLTAAQEYAAKRSAFDPASSLILSVLREPIDRERSMYLYYRNVLANSPTLETDLPDAEMRRAVDRARDLDFVGWLDWQDAEFGHCDLWRSERYYRTDTGSIPSGLNILRFENLEDDLRHAVSKLNLSVDAVPQLNTTDRKSVDLSIPSRVEEFIRHSYRWMDELPARAFANGRGVRTSF